MGISAEILIYLLVYLVGILGYSIYISRKQTNEDFLISSRNRSWFSIGMSKYATSIGASWLIAYTSYIYVFGFGVFSLVLGYMIAMGILAMYIGPKLHSVAKKNNFIKIGDIVKYRTGNIIAEKVANFFSSFVLFLALLMIVSSGANLISYFGLLSYEFSLIGIMFVVLAYTFSIGYKGVVSTDVIQSIIISFVLILIAYFLFTASDFNTLSKVEFSEVSLGTVFGFLVFGIFSTFSFIDRYQVLFSGKDEKQVKKGFLFVVPLILLTVLLLLMIGYYVRSETTTLEGGLVFMKAIELYIPESILPIAIVMFFATVMSSADSYIYGISSHFNLVKKFDRVKNIKLNILLVTLITGLIAFYFRDVVSITLVVSGLSLVLSVPMFYLFYGKSFDENTKFGSRFIFSALSSLGGLLTGFAIFGLTPVVALFAILFGFVGLLFKCKN